MLRLLVPKRLINVNRRGGEGDSREKGVGVRVERGNLGRGIGWWRIGARVGGGRGGESRIDGRNGEEGVRKEGSRIEGREEEEGETRRGKRRGWRGKEEEEGGQGERKREEEGETRGEGMGCGWVGRL